MNEDRGAKIIVTSQRFSFLPVWYPLALFLFSRSQFTFLFPCHLFLSLALFFLVLPSSCAPLCVPRALAEKFDFLISGGHSGWQIASPVSFPPKRSQLQQRFATSRDIFLGVYLFVGRVKRICPRDNELPVIPAPSKSVFRGTREEGSACLEPAEGYLVLSEIAWRGASWKYVKCVSPVCMYVMPRQPREWAGSCFDRGTFEGFRGVLRKFQTSVFYFVSLRFCFISLCFLIVRRIFKDVSISFFWFVLDSKF